MSDHYNPRVTPWAVDEAAFPVQGTAAERLRFLLNYAILAPSGHNTQPWKFSVDPAGPKVMAYADYTRRLAVVDPADRELVMSVAAALFNLRVAAAYFGMRCQVTPMENGAPAQPGKDRPDVVLLASADLEPGEPEPGLAELFPAIIRRRTNRAPYLPRPLAPEHRAVLTALSPSGGLSPSPASGDLPAHPVSPSPAGLCLIEDPAIAGRLAELVAEGDRRQMADPAFRSELASWVRPDAEGEAVAADGFAVPDLMTWGGAWFIRTLNLGSFAARRDAARAHDAAALAVIFGPDTLPALLAAGELLERALLTCAMLGLECSYLNQPVEVAALRDEVQAAVRLPLPPQVLLRLGYAAPMPRAMPRRRVEDVLIS